MNFRQHLQEHGPNSRNSKELEKRDKAKTALNCLRYAIQLADPAKVLHEKVVIIEGAVEVLQKLTGASIDYSNEDNTTLNEKLSCSEVEKRRRARESRAIDALKEILIEHTKEAHAKMNRTAVITCAADFIKTRAEMMPRGGTSQETGTRTSHSGSKPTFDDSRTNRSPPSPVLSPAVRFNTRNSGQPCVKYRSSGFWRPWE